MSPREIFRAYVAEQRQRVVDGYRCEDLGYLVRRTGTHRVSEGWVMFSDLPLDRADLIIDEQIRHFASAGHAFEWKLYGFDLPAGLRARLQARGFVADPVEAFLVRLVSAAPAVVVLPADVEIRRVSDAAGAHDIAAVQKQVWGGNLPDSMRSEMLRRIAAGGTDCAVFCAYAHGQPVASAWTNYSTDSQFADLHGGAILPEYRGRGLYAALLQCREADAHRRGIRFLAVDAAPLSRPILLRKGFQFVCDTWPMKWSRANQSHLS